MGDYVELAKRAAAAQTDPIRKLRTLLDALHLTNALVAVRERSIVEIENDLVSLRHEREEKLAVVRQHMADMGIFHNAERLPIDYWCDFLLRLMQGNAQE